MSDETVLHPALICHLHIIIFGIFTLPFVIGIFILLYVYLKLHTTRYTFTSSSVVTEQGIISRNRTTVLYSDMRAVNYCQGLFGLIFNYGDVTICSAATAGAEIVMSGISGPKKICKMLEEKRMQSLK